MTNNAPREDSGTATPSMTWRNGRLRRSVVALTGLAVLLVLTYELIHHYRHAALPIGANPRDVLNVAEYTRGLAAELPGTVKRLLDTMPSAVLPRDASSDANRLLVWSLFFKGSMIKLGRLATPTPEIAYYNPILDVVLIENCRYSNVDGKPRCLHMCAKPGEALIGEPLALSPGWLKERDPLEALRHEAAKRMAVFDKLTQESAQTANGMTCTVKEQAASELRVVDAAQTLAHIPVDEFSRAIAAYISKTAQSGRARRPATGSSPSADRVLKVMMHLDQLTLSGAVTTGKQDWLLFFTPKRSGWGEVALDFSVESDGVWILKRAQLISMSAKAT